MATVEIEGVALREASPASWCGGAAVIGHDETLELGRVALGLAAGGYEPAPGELPLFPVLTGPPGTGKTTMAFQLATEASQGSAVYLMAGHPDALPEDVVVTPVLGADRSVHYQMSPLATAAFRGAPAILDEASRLQPATWAALLGLLDDRRSLWSTVAGVRIPVHPGFRLILTMNQDEETHSLPPAVRSRLAPFLRLDPPGREYQARLLTSSLTRLPERLIRDGLRFLWRRLPSGEPLAPRELIQLFELYDRLCRSRGTSEAGAEELLLRSLHAVRMAPEQPA